MNHVQRPWEASYSGGVSWDESLDIRSLGSYLAEAAHLWPSKAALIFGDERYTYAELWVLAQHAARAFSGLGVVAGINVAILFANCPRHSIMCFGVLLAGGTVVNLSADAASQALADQLAQTGAVILVSSADALGSRQIGDVTAGSAVRTVIICGSRTVESTGASHIAELDLESFLAHAVDWAPDALADLDQIALLQFTGGTTGAPKAAMLRHRNVSAAIELVRCWLGKVFLEPDRRCAAALPISHIFGLVTLLSCIATGTPVILYRKFDPLVLIEAIEREQITIFFGVPTMYAAMLATGQLSPERMKSLSICMAGGAPLNPKLEQAFRKATNISVREGYGMTETSAVCVLQPAQSPAKPEVTGLPVPRTTVEIVDLENGEQLLSSGHVGEVCISGPQVMAGYWGQAEETAHVFRGGRLHTGDIGFIDQEGYLKLVDRQKDMILTGGFNVFPSTVEAALRQHPAVLDAVVVGVSHSFMGQLVKAFLRPRPDVGPCKDAGLLSFLSARLAPHEIPMSFEWIDRFPQTKVGKIDRKLMQRL